MKYPKPIYIEWADAMANSGWATAQEAVEWGECSNWYVRALGWLLNETDEYIILALEYKEADDYGGEKFCNLQKIPKTWIRKRKYIKDL